MDDSSTADNEADAKHHYWLSCLKTGYFGQEEEEATVADSSVADVVVAVEAYVTSRATTTPLSLSSPALRTMQHFRLCHASSCYYCCCHCSRRIHPPPRTSQSLLCRAHHCSCTSMLSFVRQKIMNLFT